jgi:hypothetical protein
MIIPNAIASLSEGLISLQRIDDFLNLPDAPPAALERGEAADAR